MSFEYRPLVYDGEKFIVGDVLDGAKSFVIIKIEDHPEVKHKIVTLKVLEEKKDIVHVFRYEPAEDQSGNPDHIYLYSIYNGNVYMNDPSITDCVEGEDEEQRE